MGQPHLGGDVGIQEEGASEPEDEQAFKGSSWGQEMEMSGLPASPSIASRGRRGTPRRQHLVAWSEAVPIIHPRHSLAIIDRESAPSLDDSSASSSRAVGLVAVRFRVAAGKASDCPARRSERTGPLAPHWKLMPLTCQLSAEIFGIEAWGSSRLAQQCNATLPHGRPDSGLRGGG